MSVKNQNFTPLFRKGEKVEIYGRGNFNFKVLIVILTFTFCAIGGANLALKDLETKMSDPFVNLLSVDIPSSMVRQVEELKQTLSQDSLKAKYNYASITNYVEFPVAFSGPGRSKWVKGRSIELNNPILERLLDQDNLIMGEGFRNESELGLIISQRLLDELGYDEMPTHINMRFNNRDVPIPIRALVRELPELNYFVASPFFFYQRTQQGGSAFDIIRNNKLSLFYKGDEEDSRQFQKRLEAFFKGHVVYKVWDVEVLKRRNSESHTEGAEFSLEFFGYRPEKSSDYDQLVADLAIAFENEPFVRYYDYDFNNFPSSFRIEPDKIAINFVSLDYVRSFQNYLYDAMQIEVDIAKVRDKENFAFVKFLTETISALLIIFSIVSICFYLYNLLKNHLQKIKPNLGTFLAFGLDTKILFSLYRELLLSFIVKAIGLSLAISFGILLVFSLMTDTFDNYFALFDWKLLATVVILVGAFYMIFKWTIEAILRKTPGDLIYDR
ncbi:MAG: hypothetical protein ACJAZM_002037 [Cyclobacteriaceae bacterium]|jgi:hypothetical protein